MNMTLQNGRAGMVRAIAGEAPVGRKALAGLLGALFSATAAWGQLGQLVYATPYTFVTIAGSFGSQGFVDGTNADAEFYFPLGAAVDTNDNVYVVDNYYNTVRWLAPAGTNWVVSTIAGNTNSSGSANGTNLDAEFNEPTALALDGAGNLYVLDGGNNLLRELTPQGTNWVSSTLAGTVGSADGRDGTNAAAHFSYPCGVAVDQTGKLYVADTYNDTIRLVTPQGTNWVVTTIAGQAGNAGGNDGTNQAALFYQPAGIAVDQGGNVYVADSGNYTIRKITPAGTNWVVKTIAGTAGNFGGVDGTNGDASFFCPILFYGPMGLAVDAQTNLYVADGGNGLIRKVSPVGTNWVTTTLAGSVGAPAGSSDGTGTNAVFGTPSGIAVDVAGNVFVSDPGANTVREGSPPSASNPVTSLAISLTGANPVNAVIAWPATGTWLLQTNADLATPNWGVYGGTVNTANGTNSVTVPPWAPTLFFRLAH
jgi:sugar lactone lactonase YvrE